MDTRTHGGLLPKINLHGSFEGRSSRLYDVIARSFLRDLYRRIAEDIAIAAPIGGVVLDVGAGPGVLLAEIARDRSDLQVAGIDRSIDMIAAAERNISQFRGRASALVGDVTDLPFADGASDLIVASFTLHHWDDVDTAVPSLPACCGRVASCTSTTSSARHSRSLTRQHARGEFSPHGRSSTR